MEAKERQILLIENRGWRWERWLEQVQIRTLPTFTRTGWSVVDMDEAVHSDVLKYFKKLHVCDDDEERTIQCPSNFVIPPADTGYVHGSVWVLDLQDEPG